MNKSSMMIQQQRRDETLQAKLIGFILNHPGSEAKDIPRHLRRHLRTMEKAGFIVCGPDYGWRIRTDLTPHEK